MNDPVRLLAGGDGTDFERAILRSWETRQPSSEARARALAIVGLGVAAGLAAGSVASVAAGAAGAAGAPKAALVSASVLKWLAIGALAATFTAGAVGYALHSSAPASPATTSQAPGVSQVAKGPATPPAPVAAAPEAPAVEVGAAAVPRSYAPRHAREGLREPSTLDEEVASIERARRAVSAGNAAAAIAAVDAYDAKYPNGSLVQESMEIRIDALLRQGDRATAERLSTRFIASHPSSPYVRRIRALLAASPTR